MWRKRKEEGLLTCFVAAAECVRWKKKVKVAHYGFVGENGGRQKPEIAMGRREREP